MLQAPPVIEGYELLKYHRQYQREYYKGIEIEEDDVIRTIRWFNRKILRTPDRNNKIVICSDCYDKYKKYRKRYKSRQRTYIILGVLFAVFGIIVAQNKIVAVLLGIVIIVALYLLSFLSYMPELKLKPGADGKKKR